MEGPQVFNKAAGLHEAVTYPFKNKQRVLKALGETPGLFYFPLFGLRDQFDWEAQASLSAHF